MAANLGTIYYTVEARTAALLSAEKEVTQSMGSMTREMQSAERQAASLSTGMSKLASAIKVVVAASALREMAGLVQSYQEMSERVQMATSSQSEFEMVQRRLLDTANGTYRSLAEAQELYIRTADSLRSMGYTTEQAIDITDSMSYAFVTNATSADRAAAATSAFSKSMNTGKVAADQWETITSAIPSVIRAIADASGKSAAEVRALGAAGKLSARDLSEGLRKSLDEVSAAAAKMANNLTDAGVRSATALTAVLVALEDQTGALQTFTDGIIAAADAVLAFSEDAEKMEGFLQLATVAGASLAAIMAGRMVSAMWGYAAAQVGVVRATQQRLLQEKSLAVVAHNRAKQEQAAAQRALDNASNDTLRARAINQLAAANQRVTATEAAKTAATTAYARAATAAGVAVRGMSAAMALIGGWPGLILLVGAAFLTMGRNASIAEGDLQKLADAIEKVGTKTLELRRIQLERAIAEQTEKVREAERVWRTAARQIDLTSKAQQNKAEIDAIGAAKVEALTEKENELRDALAATNKELERRASGADVGPQTPPGWTPPNDDGGGQTESQAQKRLQSMRDELALAQQAGVARERLRAIQQLGAEATKEEREEAERLATQIYDLEQAQKASQKAREEAEQSRQDELKGIEANADLIAQLEEQMRQAEMTAGELAARQAELALNEYATPEQIRRVRELGEAMRENAELERMEKMRDEAIAADPRTAAANQYQQQLEAYRAYKEAELLTDQQYNELKNAAATQYEQQRLAAQEEIFRAQSRGNEFLMNSIDALGQASTDVLSGILSGTMNGKEAMQAFGQAIFREAIGAVVQMGVQYVKSLIMGQAAQTAAAATAVATGGAVAAAWAPAAALVSLATLGANAAPASAGITTTMGVAQGMSLAGGRQYGGPVAAGKLYRINENGAPEVFNAANGRQYMMPNTRGEVVSNKDATESGKGSPVEVRVIVNEAPPGTSVEQRTAADGVQEFVVDLRQGGPRAKALEAYYGMRRVGR